MVWTLLIASIVEFVIICYLVQWCFYLYKDSLDVQAELKARGIKLSKKIIKNKKEEKSNVKRQTVRKKRK